MRFQPIRRPQAPQKKSNKPTAFPKPLPTQGSANDTAAAPQQQQQQPTGTSTPPVAPSQQQRSTLADWTAAGADDEFLTGAAVGEKRQRGGRKAAKKRNNKKKSDQQQQWQRETDWDEVYDPARPTNVDEYLRGEERVREVQEWKAVLYAHRLRLRRGRSEAASEESEEERAGVGGSEYLCLVFLSLGWEVCFC